MCNQEEENKSFCISVEINGRVVKFDKNLNSVFSFNIEKGQQIDDVIPFLYGYFPLVKDSVILENLQYNDFKGNVLIKKENNDVKINFYQNPQDMDLWQKKLQKHNQDELIKSIVVKTDSKALTCNVFYTLGFMTFKKTDDKFELIGDIPDWFKLLFPNYNYSSLYFDLEELFPFLEVFLPEMESLFKKNENGKVASGLWTETSDSINEVILQASAVNDNGHNFLFLESISDRNPGKQKNLQKLREQTLILNQLKKTEKKLREVLKTREQFISIFSHDIRGPIGGVFSLMELLLNEDDFTSSFKENYLHIFDVIYKDLRDLHEYSNKLYDWSNVNFGNMKLEKSPSNLALLVEDIVTNMRNKSHEKKIEINVNIPSDLTINVDIVFFKNAVFNLITNSIKFSNILGTIDIKASEYDDKVELVISDDGIGMEPIVINNLLNFENRISKTGTKGEKGSGIGLTIVKKILDMHNAKLDIKSKIGNGTKIIISIPKE